MATPRTVGRHPSQRRRPALPILIASCSAFPTCPIVALQSSRTSRTSPEGRRRWAKSPSLAMICAPPPAARPQPLGCQDVSLPPVRVVQRGEAGGAVRVVLDRRHLGGHAVLVPLEVDDAVEALVPAAAVPHRHFPLTVPPGGAG